MTIVAIVQARMGSSRLPGKVMRKINGTPMIGLLLERLSRARRIDRIVVATSVAPDNATLADYVESIGFSCEMGSEEDVLNRYLQAARKHEADVVVRITGDCPLVDPVLVDAAVARFAEADVDYLCNNYPPTFPDGLDIEICTMAALERAAAESESRYDHEHVTPYLRTPHLFRQAVIGWSEDLSGLRWTVDERADFDVVRNVFDHFAPRTDFAWTEVLALQAERPGLFAGNAGIGRNEGAWMGKGQKLWKRAKGVIPGGNMLLSKRPEMFLPDRWPAYFNWAKGCTVWDLDDRPYIDMSIMGIGTNTLGYGHPEIDAVVHATVDAGNMSTLNCPEEVWLAERLVEIHPWADMVRFARTGGEANAVAIRIARAASGRDKVAFCGYHGWHDWYLSANLGQDGLAGHHLTGLDPRGVPQNLAGTMLPFLYNDYDTLERLVTEQDVGVIVMEVMRNHEPTNDFLHRVRALATRHKAVLLFDECTSGFRETFGGLHKKYGVEPDMAMFGKALGNGYAITATIGRRDIMEAAQGTFISSTFWTERIGPAAALKTLDVMERERSWETITRIGLEIRARWAQLAQTHGLAIDHWGMPALAGFTIRSGNALAYKTLITQEMLAKGYLAGNSVYAATVHTPDVIDGYFEALDPIFALIAECEDGRDVMGLLTGPLAHDGFKRLN